MGKEKTISMSELRKVVELHVRDIRCPELTRALLKKHFDRLLKSVENHVQGDMGTVIQRSPSEKEKHR